MLYIYIYTHNVYIYIYVLFCRDQLVLNIFVFSLSLSLSLSADNKLSSSAETLTGPTSSLSLHSCFDSESNEVDSPSIKFLLTWFTGT